VTITVTFDPPILLPADHYFFRPEVGLSSGNFLWLSAPRPVNPPIFVGDLQSWIRNDNLAPDWSRIGTDITHEGPFNASFSLSGVMDAESIIDELVPCSGPASVGPGKITASMCPPSRTRRRTWQTWAALARAGQGKIVSEAARSDCGRRRKTIKRSKRSKRSKNLTSISQTRWVGSGFGVPSGWASHAEGRSEYLEMIFRIYATLGVFLMIASRDPVAHKSLIWFTVWSIFVHGAIIAVQSIADPRHVRHL
jgi:hypothetical protein